MNVFSAPELLSSVADVFHPGVPARQRFFRVGGRLFRLLELQGGGAVSAWPFMDFLEPADADEAARALDVGELAYLPKVELARMTADDWRQLGQSDPLVSPFVDWSLFPAHADFLAHVQARKASLLADSRRCARRLEREIGPLRFVADETRPQALEQCLRWKSRQYLDTGYADAFAVEAHVKLFSELARRRVLRVSALSAGERLLAVHAGLLHEGRFYYWIPAFDAELRNLSPGRLLLEELLKDSQARGDREFDFLLGDEAYKWNYATHARRIGPLGSPPLRARLREGLRRRAQALRQRHPQLASLARRLRGLPEEAAGRRSSGPGSGGSAAR